MQKKNGKIIFSPTDLIHFMESDFITWMNRFYLEFPNQIKPDDPDEFQTILKEKGIKHEEAILQSLKEEGREVVEIQQDENSYANTLSAMTAGKEIIYQAHLTSNDVIKNVEFSGYADFLFKVPGCSKFGDWHYEPWDTKLALTSKPSFIVQLCCYADMLETIQGLRPKSIRIILGNRVEEVLRVEDYFYSYKRLRYAFLKQQADFNPQQLPVLIGLEAYGRWTSYAEDILRNKDDLWFVANIRKTQIKKLNQGGITTLTELAMTSLNHIPAMNQLIFDRLKKQASLQLRSNGKDKPEYEIIKSNDDCQRRGLELLPPLSVSDVWFDIEGYPYAKRGLEYLFGLTFLGENGSLIYKDWWAHDHEQEKLIFQDFINWVYARWKNDKTMHIYHYGSYETTALKRLMGTYGVCEDQVDDLLTGGVFINLYKIVSEGIRVGVQQYSLKSIECLYMDSRTAAITKATDSIVYYEKWLEGQDGTNWQNSPILLKIREYNRDDCISMKGLGDWLRNIQEQEKISYGFKQELDKRQESLDETVTERSMIQLQAAALAQELVATAMTSGLAKEQEQIAMLFSYLLEFHKRERKPDSWERFHRLEMSTEELIEDIYCLGGVKCTKKLTCFEYKFDFNQETMLKKNDYCRVTNTAKPTYATIKNLDMDNGILQISAGTVLPQQFGLIPSKHIKIDSIVQSIYKTVTEWKKNGKLPKAIEDFLLRRNPRITGLSRRSIISGKGSLLEETIDVIKRMNTTTLCIQGPPGTGKTYTAAHAIVELIQKGKVVGVTSNSHKAIAHLIDMVMNVAYGKSVRISAAKIQNKDEEFHVKSKGVVGVKGKIAAFIANRFSLIGGTAWTFSNECAQGKLDYLFVDEAGQVSIANLVGMAPSTKNIVLIGDQMQLSQPIKGSHPGESGKSCFEYLLQDYQTIPSHLGILLNTSFRLHPALCTFISDAVYEGRLEPHKDTAHRHIALRRHDSNLISKSSGIVFIPVEHEGNDQSSSEEIDVISKIIDVLLQSSLKDTTSGSIKTKKLVFNDILIVTPYNVQVNKIKMAIPEANVGTMDKLQGQEAAVVIISMCSSNANDSARGLEFVLSKNRLNVALSRAKVLAIVVGSPNLVTGTCKTIRQMGLVNLFCKIIEEGSR